MAACHESAHLGAYAHGGVGMVDNRCVFGIGPDIMFFTGTSRKIPGGVLR